MSVFGKRYLNIVDEYNGKRNRLIELYKIVNNKVFPIFVPRKYLLSMDELKYREVYNFGTDFQEDVYDNNTTFYLNIPQMVYIIPNLEHFSNMGVLDPITNIPLMYDSIQEYISLWLWFKEYYFRFESESIETLKELESVALWAFLNYNYYKNYKNVKFKLSKERQFQQSNKTAIDFLRLLNVSDNKEKHSFISYVDSYLAKTGLNDYSPVNVSEKQPVVKTMFGEWK